MMKNVMMAAVLATATLTHGAAAGSLSDPVIAPALIVEDATSSSSGTSLVVALAVILSIPAFTD